MTTFNALSQLNTLPPAPTGGGGGSGDSIDIAKYVPEGSVRMRLVKYIEIGSQTSTFKGETKSTPQVILGFEISGPKVKPHPKGLPWVIDLFPINLFYSDKAALTKLFKRMNVGHNLPSVKHLPALLGKAFMGNVVHETFKKRDGTTGVAVRLNKRGEDIEIKPPVVEDPETGELKNVAVPEAKSSLMLFIWDLADAQQWQSLYIDGKWDEVKNDEGSVILPARSKNIYQEKIKAATNFKGSRIATVLSQLENKVDLAAELDDALGGMDLSDINLE